MAQSEAALFTVGVFQDLAWAERGIDALKQRGFAVESLSVAGKATPELSTFIERLLGGAPDTRVLPVIGPLAARGALADALDGPSKDLSQIGLAAAMRRAGFQPHDGLIYETLLGKGGVLVAVTSAPRVSDALTVLLSYGAGNAAIGAWSRRV